MKFIIFEDEEPAAARLKKLVLEIEPLAEVADAIATVKSAIKFLDDNATDAIIISDIHLADGSSFEIFKNTRSENPVIFTTAFDQYAIEAFKANGIDYILKPVKKEELQIAIEKAKRFSSTKKTSSDAADSVLKMVAEKFKEHQKRIIIRFGDTIKTVEINDIAYFYTQNKIDYLRTKAGVEYPVDYHLDELEKLLDPQLFFRINRQFIVNFHAIEKMSTVSKSRVKLILKPVCNEDTIVSTERSPVFKEWLTGNAK